jgi:hypothetical protein
MAPVAMTPYGAGKDHYQTIGHEAPLRAVHASRLSIADAAIARIALDGVAHASDASYIRCMRRIP